MGIVQIFLEIIFTGGSASIERLFAKSSQIINGFIKKADSFTDDVFKALDKLISLIKKGAAHFASFIRQVLDDFFEWLKNLFRSGKADDILEGGANKKLLSIWKINLLEGKMNCANCAIAVERTFAGFPASALPKSPFKIGKKLVYLNLPNPPLLLEIEFGKNLLKTLQ